MYNLLKWEFKGLFKSRIFTGMFIFMMTIGLIYVPIALTDGVKSSYEGFLGGCDFVVSAFFLAGSVFSGTFIASAFQDRMIQNVIMSGKSRFLTLLSKSIAYMASIAIFIFFPVVIISIIMMIVLGVNELTIMKLLLDMSKTLFLVVIVNSATMSVCIPISFYVKNIGSAIGLNIAFILLWYGLVQSFIMNEAVMKFLSFTSMGQAFLIYGDISAGVFMKTMLISIYTIFISLSLGYLIFRKEELK